MVVLDISCDRNIYTKVKRKNTPLFFIKKAFSTKSGSNTKLVQQSSPVLREMGS